MALPAAAALFGRILPLLGESGAVSGLMRGMGGSGLTDILTGLLGKKDAVEDKGGGTLKAMMQPRGSMRRGDVPTKAEAQWLGVQDQAAAKKAAADAAAQAKTFAGRMQTATGVVGKATGFFTKLGTITYGTASALEKFTGLLVEGRRDLGQWNGKIAASFARLDIRRMRQDIDTAQGVSGTTTALTENYGQFLEELRPIRQDIMSIMNVVGIGAAKIGSLAATVSKFLPPLMLLRTIAAAAEAIADNTDKSVATKDPLARFLDDLEKPPGGRLGAAAPPAPLVPRDPLPPIVGVK